MKRKEAVVVLCLIFIVLLVSLVSAFSFSIFIQDFWGKITRKVVAGNREVDFGIF